MTSEYKLNEIYHQTRVDMKVGSVLGPAYKKVPQRRVWIHTGDTPVVTALDLSQRSQWSPMKSYGNLWAFVGTDPPENFFDWHLHFRFESVPRMLDVSGQHMDELPRHLEEWGDIDKIESDAEKIALAAGLVFEQMQTPAAIIDLVGRMEASHPKSSRVLGMTVTGQQVLGIRIL